MVYAVSEWKFKPSDFIDIVYQEESTAKLLTQIANAKLAEWLATGVKVYSNKRVEPDNYWNGTKRYPEDTHEALLINIKPIERECSHEWLIPEKNRTTCKKCGRDGWIKLDVE